MAQLFKNNAFSALAASLTNVATTLTVTTGHGDRFPAVTAPDFFMLTLQDASNNIEVVRVTARTAGADSMTITRAQEGTTARAWNIDDVVELRLTAFALNPLSLFEGGSTASALRTSLGLGTSATVNTGTSGAVIPLLDGNNVHSGNNTFTGNQTFRATDAVRVEAAQNQDAIVLRGRAGGTGGFAAVLTPAALAATRVYTMPDAGADASFVMTAGTQTLGGTYTFSNTITGSITGNAATATTLQTARTINGTSFDGSANITTANWGTARTLTIGNTGKNVDGSAAVSWSLAEIGVVSASDTTQGIVELATAAEAAALTDASLALTPSVLASGVAAAVNASGSAPIYACRAWVNFNGTGTVAIRASGNVSSITDNGTGDYTVNFTTAMPDANYAFVGTAKGTNDNVLGANVTVVVQYNQTTTAVSLRINDSGTARDTANNGIAIFR